MRKSCKNFLDKVAKVTKIPPMALIVLGVVLLLLLLVGLWKLLIPAPTVYEEVPVTVEEPVDTCSARRLLDGVCLDDGEVAAPVVAVMIDNQISARPPVGVSAARMVYEAIAEGTITRLVALYTIDQPVAQVGPVRSARPYYISWAEEFNAAYLHVGGSPLALSLLPQANVIDVNQFFKSQYFWRSSSRYAPHNVFTSIEKIYNASDDLGLEQPASYASWLYKEEATADSRPTDVADITIDFGSPAYVVRWVYNHEENNYTRYQGGRIHVDSDGTPLVAKNVAVMYTRSVPYDDYGRRETDTIGSGDAIVFQDGVGIVATWERRTKNSRTRFYDEAGDEIAFNPGTTWVECVPKHFPHIIFE